jgi:hypothetical protein
VDLDSERRNVLLLELSGQMALDEGRLWAWWLALILLLLL